MLALQAREALKSALFNQNTKKVSFKPPKRISQLEYRSTKYRSFATSSCDGPWRSRRRGFSTTRHSLSHPRLVLSEEQEMECPHVPTMFHLGRAIKTVNLLRNLDKYGRPLGVAVSEDVFGTSTMLEAVDAIPSKALGELLSCESGCNLPSSVTLTRADMDIEEIDGLRKYPLPTPDVPGLFPNQAWKHWYYFLDQHVWKKNPTMATLAPEASKMEKVQNIAPRDVFFSSMRGALTQAVQHFPSVLSGSIPLDQADGNGKTIGKSWIRIGQSYWDAGNLTSEAISDLMAMRSEEMHFEESTESSGEFSEISQNLAQFSVHPNRARIYPGEEFRWLHFSPEDPRLLYMSIPPPLALIYQQLEQHLLLTPNFTLVPHQLEFYKEGVETLTRHDPLDPNYLGTVLIALPTSGTRGGSVRLTNLNHIPYEGSSDVAEEDLSHIDSDLSRVMAKMEHLSEVGDSSSKRASSESSLLEKQDDMDISRLDSDLAVPNAQGEAKGAFSSQNESLGAGKRCNGSSKYQNWSSFKWSPFGGEHTVVNPALVRTGRGEKKVSSLSLDCAPSGLDWIAFTKNVPYCIEKLESGSRVLMAYHIIGKSNVNAKAQQPTISEVQASLSDMSAVRVDSQVNVPLINSLFSPVMRQAGIAKLVSMIAYYFNHAQPDHWLARGQDDLTSIGLALRDTYAPEQLATEQLMGADAWLLNIFKWAILPSSGIFQHPVRLILAPIAMIHQSQLHAPPYPSGPNKSPLLHSSASSSSPPSSSQSKIGHHTQTTASNHVQFKGNKRTNGKGGKEPLEISKKMTEKPKNIKEFEKDALATSNGTGSDRWEPHEKEMASSMVYFLNLEGWEHDGPSFSQQTYSDCARFSALPARPLSDMERNLYGSAKHPSNTETQWNSIPLLFGQRWGEELDTWEPHPMLSHDLHHQSQNSDPDSFRVVGRKTYATTAIVLQRIQKEQEKL